MSRTMGNEDFVRGNCKNSAAPGATMMYHGTARKCLAFRPNAVAYFSPSLDDGRAHALMDAQVEGGTARVLCCRLSVTNPARIDTILMQDLHSLPDEVARLKELGHDCALGEHETGEIVVFDRANIHIESILDI